MRYGKPLGNLNWRVKTIPLLGSSHEKMSDETRKMLINGEGVNKKNRR